jgi:hypothetical protein
VNLERVDTVIMWLVVALSVVATALFIVALCGGPSWW